MECPFSFIFLCSLFTSSPLTFLLALLLWLHFCKIIEVIQAFWLLIRDFDDLQMFENGFWTLANILKKFKHLWVDVAMKERFRWYLYEGEYISKVNILLKNKRSRQIRPVLMATKIAFCHTEMLSNWPSRSPKISFIEPKDNTV